MIDIRGLPLRGQLSGVRGLLFGIRDSGFGAYYSGFGVKKPTSFGGG